jgi:hypothetical protein
VQSVVGVQRRRYHLQVSEFWEVSRIKAKSIDPVAPAIPARNALLNVVRADCSIGV